MAVQSISPCFPLPAGATAANGISSTGNGAQTLAANDTRRGDDAKLKETFEQFVGETFYGQMLKAMRKTVDKPAYFHGGRGEEIFQQQLDQVLAHKMSDATAETFSQPMYELFTMQRR